jgi:hypothetical protein
VETVKLTVHLPKKDVHFAKEYAQAHRIALDDLIGRFLRSLREGTSTIHPEVEKISALVPATVDAKGEHRQHVLEKHR